MKTVGGLIVGAVMMAGAATQAQAACARTDFQCLLSSPLGIGTPTTTPSSNLNFANLASRLGASLGPQGTARLQSTLGVLASNPRFSQFPALRNFLTTFSQNL